MKRVWILIVWLALLVPLSGQEMPFTATVDISNYEDHYDLVKPVNVYIKENGSYKTEIKTVSVNIAPQDYCYAQGQYLKDYFIDVLVYIVIKTAEGDTTEEFQSYLNLELPKQRLFWDHAGYSRADRAGQILGENDSLVVKDRDIEVTLALMQFMPSENNCGSCDTDAETYINFIDVLRLRLTIDYTQTQKDTIEEMGEDQEKYEDAQQYIAAAQQYYQQGEFKKAKDEYQKAKDLFDEIGDTDNSDEMQEWIDKCLSYDIAAENLKEGIQKFEEASRTDDYQEAIDKFEEARSYFQRAQTEFDRVEDTSKSDECETWIDRCDDEIENLKGVGTLRGKLIYIILAIVVVAGAGVVMKQLGKRKPPKPSKSAVKRAIQLTVQNAETGQEAVIEVEATDKIGKVRQLAATKLGIIPSALLCNEKVCPPDQTVQECGLRDGVRVKVVPRGKEPPSAREDHRDKLEKLEQRYREGKISKELYESLKHKLESE